MSRSHRPTLQPGFRTPGADSTVSPPAQLWQVCPCLTYCLEASIWPSQCHMTSATAGSQRQPQGMRAQLSGHESSAKPPLTFLFGWSSVGGAPVTRCPILTTNHYHPQTASDARCLSLPNMSSTEGCTNKDRPCMTAAVVCVLCPPQA